MKWVSVLGCVLVLFFNNEIIAQDNYRELDVLLEELMDVIPEEQLEQLDWSDLLEQLNFFRENPMDINSVSFEDLQKLGLIPPTVALSILNYRKESGSFLDLRELQSIEGLNIAYARLISQFFMVRKTSDLVNVSSGDLIKKGTNELFVRYSRPLEQASGYQITDTERSRYLGSRDRLLIRYRYSWMDALKVSLNMEKDAGEQFFKGAQKYGFDFYSLSVQMKNLGKLNNLVLGDYVLQFGQGLGIWSGYAMGKGAILHGIARQGVGLKSHTSLDEIKFFRGIAGVFYLNKMRFTPFLSYRKRDGNVQEDVFGDKFVPSLATSGLYRTPNEIRNRHQVAQVAYGLNVQFEEPVWKWGVTWYKSSLDTRLVPPDLLRNQYSFSGSDLSHLSLYYQGNIKHVYLFGEAAQSNRGGYALLNGALMSMHHDFSLAVLHRYYQRDHHSFYADSFGQGNFASNENGIYVGIQYQPNRNVSLVFYYDGFSFPWAKYRVDGPSKGRDILSQLSFSKSRKYTLSLRLRYQEKQENLLEELPESLLATVRKIQYRVSFDADLSDNWRIRNRVEMVTHQQEMAVWSQGWMVYQDLFYRPMGSKFQGNFRIAAFGTADYNTRIYAFENDVLYANSFPVYYGNGFRSYLNLRWKINRSIDLWLRYAHFYYPEASSLGSGLDEISGQKRSEVKTQIRIRIP